MSMMEKQLCCEIDTKPGGFILFAIYFGKMNTNRCKNRMIEWREMHIWRFIQPDQAKNSRRNCRPAGIVQLHWHRFAYSVFILIYVVGIEYHK